MGPTIRVNDITLTLGIVLNGLALWPRYLRPRHKLIRHNDFLHFGTATSTLSFTALRRLFASITRPHFSFVKAWLDQIGKDTGHGLILHLPRDSFCTCCLRYLHCIGFADTQSPAQLHSRTPYTLDRDMVFCVCIHWIWCVGYYRRSMRGVFDHFGDGLVWPRFGM